MRKSTESGVALLSGILSCSLYLLFAQWLFEIDLLKNLHGWVAQAPVTYQYHASVLHFAFSDLFAMLPAIIVTGVVLGMIVRSNPWKIGFFATWGFCVFLMFSSVSFGIASISIFLVRVIAWCILSVVATGVGIRLGGVLQPCRQ